MPADTMILIGVVGAAFAYFAAMLVYCDLTWDA